jgi:hypothetical protein
MLVSLTAVKNKVGSGVRDPSQIFANQSTEVVVRSWTDLKERGAVSFSPRSFLFLT